MRAERLRMDRRREPGVGRKPVARARDRQQVAKADVGILGVLEPHAREIVVDLDHAAARAERVIGIARRLAAGHAMKAHQRVPWSENSAIGIDVAPVRTRSRIATPIPVHSRHALDPSAVRDEDIVPAGRATDDRQAGRRRRPQRREMLEHRRRPGSPAGSGRRVDECPSCLVRSDPRRIRTARGSRRPTARRRPGGRGKPGRA